ncbi:hypothetical protein DRJ25_02225 [Candidatus Woesearchaeota archaeon]|nr:MAG: hypothetical protein DRJ25_02225 [Candidatus Woesearchaeota archaeon]
MRSEDKKVMALLVLVTIFLGLIMIVFLKPDYESEQIGAASVENEKISGDFSILFEDFLQQDDADANFINEET